MLSVVSVRTHRNERNKNGLKRKAKVENKGTEWRPLRTTRVKNKLTIRYTTQIGSIDGVSPVTTPEEKQRLETECFDSALVR